MSDIEIARKANMWPIVKIGEKLNIPPEHLHHFGPTKAKLSAAADVRAAAALRNDPEAPDAALRKLPPRAPPTWGLAWFLCF